MTWTYNDFAIENMKLTLPYDEDHDDTGNEPQDGAADEIINLEGYEFEDLFFYDHNLEAMIMTSPVIGSTTTGSGYTRMELREMDYENPLTDSQDPEAVNSSDYLADWNIEEGGTMSGTLAVLEMPTEYETGVGWGEYPGFEAQDQARMMFAQIHANDFDGGSGDELVRLYYDADGYVYYNNNNVDYGENDIYPEIFEDHFYFADVDGNLAQFDLGQSFSYEIDVSNDELNVTIYSEGVEYTAQPGELSGADPTEIIDVWDSDTFYFKAGVYNGTRSEEDHWHDGEGQSTVAYLDFDMGHDGEGGSAWDNRAEFDGDELITLDDVGEPEPEPTESTEGTSGDDNLVGTDAIDELKGQEGNDTISGGGGNDILWGNDGDDTIIGDDGADWLKGGPGADTYVLEGFTDIDTIADFSNPNGDVIDVTAYGSDDVTWTQDGADTLVFVDDTQIAILLDEDASELSSSDFVTNDAGDSAATLDASSGLDSTFAEVALYEDLSF